MINKVPYHKDSFHVSFSEYRKWKECQRKYKYDVIDQRDVFEGNEHTEFGTCVHEFCQDLLAEKIEPHLMMIDWYDRFEQMTNVTECFINLNERGRQTWADQGMLIVDAFWKKRTTDWKHLQFVKAELELMIDIPVDICESLVDDRQESSRFNQPPRFKGFIDVLMKDREGNHYIIDLKTATKPWNQYKFNDEVLNAQLKLYKHFYHLQEKVLYKNIKTWYYVMPRTETDNYSQLIKKDYSPAAIKKELKELSYFFNQTYINRQYWPNIGSFYCKYCPYVGTKDCKETKGLKYGY